MLLALALAMTLQDIPPDMTPKYMDASIRVLATRPSVPLKERRVELLKDLGLYPPPERAPLNAKVTGTLRRDGYVIEKIVYETFPKFYCTAYLYLPAERTGPVPAVVCPVGHWSKKKLEPVVQARCVGLALYGFAALCIDMPGFVGDNDDERNFPGSHNDWVLHMCSLPPAGVMAWDVVRGIDYLETRPEIDVSRIGCTGVSGGGLTTMYVGVIEPRVACYVPACYATSFEDNYDNGCLCNHVPGVMLLGDRADLMALAAPKPVLLLGAEIDPEFPKEGTLRSHRKLVPLYGDPADCQVLIAPGGHDYSKPMRERMYGFFRKHLMGLGDGGPAPEPRKLPEDRNAEPVNVERWGDPETLCFPGGKAPADAVSLRDLARAKAERLLSDPSLDASRETLRKRLFALYPNPERAPLDVREKAGKGTFVSEPGLRLPFELSLPARPRGTKSRARIVFSDKGMADEAARPEPAEGVAELRLDGRGLGRTPGLEMRLATYVGRPDVWMWAWDVSRAVDYLEARGDVDLDGLEVWGFGPAGAQVAMMAGLIDPRIARVRTRGGLRSYLDCFERTDLPRFAMPHRILEAGDIPHFRKALGMNDED